MAFSDEFLMGLATKSDDFQQQFFGIMEKFYSFFDYNEDDVDAFQNDIIMVPQNRTTIAKKNVNMVC